jgi:transcriptional regulator with XRE-family HTH domain
MHWFENPEELKKRRKEVGLTQSALARKAGIKLSMIADVETGRQLLKGELQKKLWDAISKERMKKNVPVVARSLAKGIDEATKDRKQSLVVLIGMISDREEEDDDSIGEAAIFLFKERYAELDAEGREWVGRELNDRLQRAKEALDPRRNRLAIRPKSVGSEPLATDLSSVQDRLISLQKLIARQRKRLPPETPEQAVALQAEKEALERENQKLREALRVNEEILAIHDKLTLKRGELIEELEVVLSQISGEKNAKIAELEQQIADLRELYDAGTQAALAHEKFEELREKVSAGEPWKGR